MSRRSPNLSNREGGFTLIEVLAALAITSLIIMSTAALMWNVTLFFDRGTRGVNQADRLVLAVDRLAADFAAARFAQRVTAGRSAEAAFIGQSGEGAQPPKVVFVSGDTASTSAQPEEVVVLSVEQANHGTRLVRRRAPWLGPRTQLETIAPKDPVVLIEGSIDVSFAFGKVAPDGSLSWQDTWFNESTLPRFVRLIVNSRDTGAALLGRADFAVRSNAPPSCAADDADVQCLVDAATQRTSGNQLPGAASNQTQGAGNASR
jgi:prepilin-type N-terminal cleavage/methylation domain-containing protein